EEIEELSLKARRQRIALAQGRQGIEELLPRGAIAKGQVATQQREQGFQGGLELVLGAILPRQSQRQLAILRTLGEFLFQGLDLRRLGGLAAGLQQRQQIVVILALARGADALEDRLGLVAAAEFDQRLGKGQADVIDAPGFFVDL